MPFRIRMRADEVELEVDTVEELMRVPIGYARDVAVAKPQRLLTTGAPASAPRRKVRRLRAARASVAAAPVVSRVERRPSARGPVDDDAVLAILKRGPVATGAVATELRVPRHKVTERLNALEARGLAHATGQTISRRWHFGAAVPASPARRGL